jgi:hypothetical protein
MIQCYYAYDPAVKQYSMKPPLSMEFDLTCCADVMEHVPEEFVSVVLAEIGNYTKKTGSMIFSISGNLAKKRFTDGENLHATIRPLDWWVDAIRKYCGNKSFVLIYNDDSQMIPSSVPAKTDENGRTVLITTNTSIRFYNSPHFKVWNFSDVEKAYYTATHIEEVK